jgi:hypothetical protein
VSFSILWAEVGVWYFGLCSSPVMEDVPPRRDQSIHGVPPSVTGLGHSRSVPLHPTSVNGLVHSPSVDSVNALHAYICPRMYAHSSGHIQLNLIDSIAFSPAQQRAFSPHPEARPYFEIRLSAAFHTLSLRMLFRAHSGMVICTSFCVFRCSSPFAAVALSLQMLLRFRHRFS